MFCFHDVNFLINLHRNQRLAYSLNKIIFLDDDDVGDHVDEKVGLTSIPMFSCLIFLYLYLHIKI